MKFLYIVSTIAAASSINAIQTTRVNVFMDEQQIETESMVCRRIGQSCGLWGGPCCDGLFCMMWSSGICVEYPKNASCPPEYLYTKYC
ncbi:uncharacterized protein LAJ45_03018 [Morchella importuna]|uniref:uncharacterized protein n=1 Tax=Morchella importuna TaxID=1174673 RepID=UPI001E8DFB7F|nr:uncharacterized protein LAJ45_03018 [Morchella importuna]KAH8152793.1 hypothetical protein LAJ45_03018 [Morchella importuna]